MLPIQSQIEGLRQSTSFLHLGDRIDLRPELARHTKDMEAALKVLEKGRPLEAQTPDGKALVAGLTMMRPPQLPGFPPPLPNMATIWALLQQQGLGLLSGHAPSPPGMPSLPGMPSMPDMPGMPSMPALPQLSMNSALSAGQGMFKGFTTEGSLDLNPDLGLDYSLTAAPDGSLAGEFATEAVLPLLAAAAGPPITVAHQLKASYARRLQALHSLRVSVPVLRGRGAARLRVRQHASSGGHALSLEMGKLSKKAERSNGGAKGAQQAQQEELDDEELRPLPATGFTRLPQLKLELEPIRGTGRPSPSPSMSNLGIRSLAEGSPPGSVRGGSGEWGRALGVQWQQMWARDVRTTASYSSKSGRAQVEGRARVAQSLLVTAGAAWDAAQGALNRLGGRVLWKPKGEWAPARLAMQIDSRYVANGGGGGSCGGGSGGGVVHSIKLRRRPKREGGFEGNLSLCLRPGAKAPELSFDVYCPT